MIDIPKASELAAKAAAVRAEQEARDAAEVAAFAQTIIDQMTQRLAPAAEAGHTSTTYRFDEPSARFTLAMSTAATVAVGSALRPHGYTVTVHRGYDRGNRGWVEVTVGWGAE